MAESPADQIYDKVMRNEVTGNSRKIQRKLQLNMQEHEAQRQAILKSQENDIEAKVIQLQAMFKEQLAEAEKTMKTINTLMEKEKSLQKFSQKVINQQQYNVQSLDNLRQAAIKQAENLTESQRNIAMERNDAIRAEQLQKAAAEQSVGASMAEVVRRVSPNQQVKMLRDSHVRKSLANHAP